MSPGGGVGLRLVRELVNGLGGRITHAHDHGATVITVAVPTHREAAHAQE